MRNQRRNMSIAFGFHKTEKKAFTLEQMCKDKAYFWL